MNLEDEAYDDRHEMVDQIDMAETDRAEAIEDLTEAIRLTVEYVGLATLPPVDGWSWYDAMRKYAPEKAKVLLDYYVKHKLYPHEETAAERARRVVTEAEEKLCECDRIDELENPHRHERDKICDAWVVFGPVLKQVMAQRDEALLKLEEIQFPEKGTT